MEIVVSGIRSTGNLHIGNYLGAIRNFVRMQDDYRCYFFIADLHSLTTHPTPEHLSSNVKQVLVEYLAAGIDPEKATIYVQSAVPEVIELYLYLNMNAYLGELERSTSFKEKVRKQPENVNAGLLTYPTLMAADILIHHATKVPVGKDQEQHLEMTRNFANRFNHLYKTAYFQEPYAFNFGTELVKVPGLNGGKMGKSEGEGNAIFLADEPEAIRRKVMRATTDSGPTQQNQEKSEPVANLFALMELVSAEDTRKHFEEQYNNCSIRYGDMKKQLAEDMVSFTAPLREKIMELSADEKYIRQAALYGAAKARESAQKTIREVREIIGIKQF